MLIKLWVQIYMQFLKTIFPNVAKDCQGRVKTDIRPINEIITKEKREISLQEEKTKRKPGKAFGFPGSCIHYTLSFLRNKLLIQCFDQSNSNKLNLNPKF